MAQRQLLILDLNGFFIDRVYDKNYEIRTNRIGNFLVWKRKGTKKFLDYAFANFDVAVWSSACKYNVNRLLKYVFGDYSSKLTFVWDQSHCKLSDDCFLKNLEDVWEKFPQYNENNTLIIDDTELKMKNNPKSCVIMIKTWNRTMKNSKINIKILSTRKSVE